MPEEKTWIKIDPYQIKALRRRNKWSADKLAEICGLLGRHRARTVYDWEKGKLKPNVDRLAVLQQLIMEYTNDAGKATKVD